MCVCVCTALHILMFTRVCVCVQPTVAAADQPVFFNPLQFTPGGAGAGHRSGGYHGQRRAYPR